MGTTRNQASENASARGKIYGLLATVFRAEPGEEFIKWLKAPGFFETLSELGVSLGDEFSQSSSSTLAERLALEYTKLFIGPGSHISPHESIFINIDGSEGGLWGAKTVEVKKFIESAGFDYKPEFTGLPDHISAELELMQKLAQTEAELRSNNETERADWCLRVQRKFLEEHLSKWVFEFCDQVIERAEIPFYAEFAAVTKDFVEFDRRNVDELLLEAA